jgi:hypothetical protein
MAFLTLRPIYEHPIDHTKTKSNKNGYILVMSFVAVLLNALLAAARH